MDGDIDANDDEDDDEDDDDENDCLLAMDGKTWSHVACSVECRDSFVGNTTKRTATVSLFLNGQRVAHGGVALPFVPAAIRNAKVRAKREALEREQRRVREQRERKGRRGGWRFRHIEHVEKEDQEWGITHGTKQ